MAVNPITVDLRAIVTKVTGISPKHIFNDKRKTFTRRYKFPGIRNLSKKQVTKIHLKISKLHPNKMFEVVNVDTIKKQKGSWVSRYTGLIVKVL
jgi:hypothetical protein